MNMTRTGLLAFILSGTASLAIAHGDVAPQAVDTSSLPAVGEEWLTENPYREPNISHEEWIEVIRVGASGYNQNCARCHGLEVISGGLAPDLRFLEAEEYGDEWYVERFRNGYTQNGITKMPAFGELLGQEAAWAIRTYIEARPDDQAVVAHEDDLKAMRDTLAQWGTGEGAPDPDAMKAELKLIADEIETLSGAPLADSVAYRAYNIIDGTPASYTSAAEALTIGLSAAH